MHAYANKERSLLLKRCCAGKSNKEESPVFDSMCCLGTGHAILSVVGAGATAALAEGALTSRVPASKNFQELLATLRAK